MAHALKVAPVDAPTPKNQIDSDAFQPSAAAAIARPKIGRKPAFMEKPAIELIPQPDPQQQEKKARPLPRRRDVAKLLVLGLILTMAVGYGLKQQPSTTRAQLDAKREALIEPAPTPQVVRYGIEGQSYAPLPEKDIASQIVPLPKPTGQTEAERAERRELLGILKK